MPAAERRFTALAPQRLYIDTDIFVNYLFTGQPYHERCRLFLRRLMEAGLTTLYLSSLVWNEFIHTIRRESFRAALTADIDKSFDLARWEAPFVRERYLSFYHEALDDILDNFDWFEVPFDGQVRTEAFRLIVQYNLGSQDAVHLASANLAGVLDLASFDRQFRRIDGLYLWNDLIYPFPG